MCSKRARRPRRMTYQEWIKRNPDLPAAEECVECDGKGRSFSVEGWRYEPCALCNGAGVIDTRRYFEITHRGAA